MVKLTRTLAIIPITLALACWQMHLARKAGGDAKSTFSLKRAFPMFVLFFVLASVITTVFQLPASFTAPIKELSKFFIVMAMRLLVLIPISSSWSKRAASPSRWAFAAGLALHA